MLGLSTFYWVLIGSVSGSVILIAIISGICGYKLHSKKNTTDSPKKSSGGNTFVHNDIQINPESKFRFEYIKRKKNNSMRLEEIPVQSLENIPVQTTKIKELEGVLTLGEQLALEAKESA